VERIRARASTRGTWPTGHYSGVDSFRGGRKIINSKVLSRTLKTKINNNVAVQERGENQSGGELPPDVIWGRARNPDRKRLAVERETGAHRGKLKENACTRW